MFGIRIVRQNNEGLVETWKVQTQRLVRYSFLPTRDSKIRTVNLAMTPLARHTTPSLQRIMPMSPPAHPQLSRH